MDHSTARLALTQSGDVERRRRAEADADAAAEEIRHAGLAVELAAAQAEIGALRHAHRNGSGSEPQAEPGLDTPALLGAVRSDGALLTLVCLADGAAVQVPLTAAAEQSQLVRTMLENTEDGAAGTVLSRANIHWLIARRGIRGFWHGSRWRGGRVICGGFCRHGGRLCGRGGRLCCFRRGTCGRSGPLAPVAQLDRVPGYEPGGRTFESCQARHTTRKATPSGWPFFVCMARQEGFEPSTDALEGHCSIQLSYWRTGASYQQA